YRRLYRPVVTVALWTQVQAFGEGTFGYHAVSLALHLLCVFLACGWLRRRHGSLRREWALLFGLLVFAIHPGRPETVTWISGSTDLWMTAFVLLSARGIDREGWPHAVASFLFLVM